MHPPTMVRVPTMSDLAGAKIAFFGFTGMIEPTGATKIAAAFNHAVNQGYDEVMLAFSSNGGYVADGIYLYNHIKALPIKTTIYNTGSVSSIAVAIFLAAEGRFCSKNSMFMIHPNAFANLEGMSAHRLESALSAALADDERTESILRERAHFPDGILADRRKGDVHITPSITVAFSI